MTTQQTTKTTLKNKKAGPLILKSEKPTLKSSPVSNLPQVKRTKVPHPFLSEKTQLAIDVPECVLHYAHALIDPFEAPAGVCIPSELFPIPSQKAKVFLRGTLALSTSGVGFIVARGCTANDQAACITTSATSVGTNATTLNGFTNTITNQFTSNPFSTFQFTTGLYSRIASLGVRVKYIGPLMSRNGMLAALEEPDHASVFTTMNYDQVLANQYSNVSYIGDNEWDCQMSYSGPVNPTDVDFQPGNTPITSNQFMAIVISGSPGDKYAFELVQHHEYAGSVCVGKTASHADPQLFAKVSETAKSLTESSPLMKEDEPTFWTNLVSNIEKSLPYIVSIGKGALRAFEGDLTGLLEVGAGALGLGGANYQEGSNGEGYKTTSTKKLLMMASKPKSSDSPQGGGKGHPRH